ncbi:MAG: type I methionyl aminopeptidase [Cytophagales bacterium]
MFWRREKIQYKSVDELELIKKSGDVLGRVHGELSRNVREGVRTLELDRIAYEFIKDNRAVPSFLKYREFPSSLCISVNDTVVHGLPSDYELRNGDIVSIDCGVLLSGYHADSAYTYSVGDISAEKRKLLRVTKESLYEGIKQAKAGMRVGDISFAIQSYNEREKYGVVRELVGHGVGRNLHEEPEVPNFGRRGKGHKLITGMVLAIEPMINLGTRDVYQLEDNWTVKTSDGRPSAHFEHTVAVLNGSPEVLTTFDYIIKEQVI